MLQYDIVLSYCSFFVFMVTVFFTDVVFLTSFDIMVKKHERKGTHDGKA